MHKKIQMYVYLYTKHKQNFWFVAFALLCHIEGIYPYIASWQTSLNCPPPPCHNNTAPPLVSDKKWTSCKMRARARGKTKIKLKIKNNYLLRAGIP